MTAPVDPAIRRAELADVRRVEAALRADGFKRVAVDSFGDMAMFHVRDQKVASAPTLAALGAKLREVAGE